MRFPAALFAVVSGILLAVTPAEANFFRDVISGSSPKHQRRLPFVSGVAHHEGMEDELLANAIPIEEYNRQLKSLGVDVPNEASRALEDAAADDYYMNEKYMYSFSGYSLKYAKCQPVQRFSEDALQAGEYSPMVTEDIVIMRLCPYKSCSSSRQYGCHYNYAEYAIGLNDYIRIMLRHKADKKEKLCEWCAACNGRRQLEEGEQEGENQNEQQQEGDENNQQENNNGQQGNKNDDYYAADDDKNGNNNKNYNYYEEEDPDDCYTYSSYCTNYYYECDEDGQAEAQNNDDQYNYVAEDEYFDYLACSELKDNNGNIYFVRPSCDQSEDKISMDIFYDEYCSQYAGDVVSKNNFEVSFNDTLFEEFYDGTCVDCSESNYPPAFNTNSYMCNLIHARGADCTNNMIYDLFDGESSDSTECSFIESIRFGTYDQNGEIAVYPTADAQESVTDLQKIGLIGSAVICALLVVYACYLHHAMTNLLIKSLSHRELLPPSRQNNKRRSPKPRRRRSKGSSRGDRRSDEEDDEDDEWDHSKPLRSPV